MGHYNSRVQRRVLIELEARTVHDRQGVVAQASHLEGVVGQRLGDPSGPAPAKAQLLALIKDFSRDKDEIALAEVCEVAFLAAVAHALALLSEAGLHDQVEVVHGLDGRVDVKRPLLLGFCELGGHCVRLAHDG